MASRNATKPTLTTVTCVEHHPTLVLRHRVQTISEELANALHNSVSEAHTQMTHISEKKMAKHVQTMCKQFKEKFTTMLEGAAAEVKQCAPEKPVREKYPTEEGFLEAKQKYAQEWDAYLTFVATSDYVIRKVGDLIPRSLDMYQTFLTELFQVSVDGQSSDLIAKKISEFNDKLKDEVLTQVIGVLDNLVRHTPGLSLVQQ